MNEQPPKIRYRAEITYEWNGGEIARSLRVKTFDEALYWVSAWARQKADTFTELHRVVKVADGLTIVDFGSHSVFGRIVRLGGKQGA